MKSRPSDITCPRLAAARSVHASPSPSVCSAIDQRQSPDRTVQRVGVAEVGGEATTAAEGPALTDGVDTIDGAAEDAGPVGRTARRSNAAGQVLHRDLKPENSRSQGGEEGVRG